jgi:hypothetical protein
MDVLPVACFAPPLDDSTLSKYESMISSVKDPELKEGLDTCLNCVKAWYVLPESKGAGRTLGILHKDKPHTYTVTPLEDKHIKTLWDVTPWIKDCEPLKVLFDKLTDKATRDMAFHLLWHTIELALDREPVTQDKLKAV